MELNGTSLIICLVIYYIIITAIGVIKSKSSSKIDYIAKPNSTGSLILSLTILATIVGGGMFLGIAEMGYNGGLIFVGIGLIYFGGNIMLSYLAPQIRSYLTENGQISLYQLLDESYPGDSIRPSNLYKLVNFLVYLLMYSVQIVSIAILFSYFTGNGLDQSVFYIGGILAIASIISYTIAGGFERDLITDTIQVAVIVIGMCFMLSNSDLLNGLLDSCKNINSSHVSFEGKYSLIYLVGALIFVAPSFIARYDIWQRIMTAKSDKTAKQAFLVSGLLSVIFFVFFGLLGLHAKDIGISNADFSAIEVITKYLNGTSLYIVIIAFFAAVMSTADTFLSVSALSLNALWNKSLFKNDGESVKQLRISGLCVGVIGIFIAYLSQDIVEIFSVAFAFIMVFIPTILGAIFLDKTSTSKSNWSIIAGLLVLIICLFFIPKESFIPALFISSVVYYFKE